MAAGGSVDLLAGSFDFRPDAGRLMQHLLHQRALDRISRNQIIRRIGRDHPIATVREPAISTSFNMARAA